jgi:hypothetical protein
MSHLAVPRIEQRLSKRLAAMRCTPRRNVRYANCVKQVSTVFKPIARFIKRGRTGDCDNGAVMVLQPDGIDALEEDMVYEIVDVLGEWIIRPIGKTHMNPAIWAKEIQDVMAGGYAPVMTEDEAKGRDE